MDLSGVWTNPSTWGVDLTMCSHPRSGDRDPLGTHIYQTSCHIAFWDTGQHMQLSPDLVGQPSRTVRYDLNEDRIFLRGGEFGHHALYHISYLAPEDPPSRRKGFAKVYCNEEQVGKLISVCILGLHPSEANPVTFWEASLHANTKISQGSHRRPELSGSTYQHFRSLHFPSRCYASCEGTHPTAAHF